VNLTQHGTEEWRNWTPNSQQVGFNSQQVGFPADSWDLSALPGEEAHQLVAQDGRSALCEAIHGWVVDVKRLADQPNWNKHGMIWKVVEYWSCWSSHFFKINSISNLYPGYIFYSPFMHYYPRPPWYLSPHGSWPAWLFGPTVLEKTALLSGATSRMADRSNAFREHGMTMNGTGGLQPVWPKDSQDTCRGPFWTLGKPTTTIAMALLPETM